MRSCFLKWGKRNESNIRLDLSIALLQGDRKNNSGQGYGPLTLSNLLQSLGRSRCCTLANNKPSFRILDATDSEIKWKSGKATIELKCQTIEVKIKGIPLLSFSFTKR